MARIKKWETSMQEQRKLKKKGAEMLHQRATLLLDCYNDAEFRQWCYDADTNELDVLDGELEDVVVGFLTLKAVLDKYPCQETWASRNIRELIAEAMESDRRDRGSPKRISWKERCLAAERECERLRAEVSSLKKSLKTSGKSRAA